MNMISTVLPLFDKPLRVDQLILKLFISDWLNCYETSGNEVPDDKISDDEIPVSQFPRF